MYIFRWLMKNPVIILALYFLSIVAILYSMTGGGSSKTEVTDTAETPKVESAEVDSSIAPVIEPSSLTSALVSNDSAEESSETTDTKITDTEINEVDKPSEVSVEAKTEDLGAEATSQLSEQFDAMSAQELLLMAREAYWNNGLDESAEIYQQLIGLNPDVVDYKGELGNVYWRQGFPEKAAELYAEISLPMLEDGNADRVANMVGFIGLFFPEKATEIHNVLEAAK